jgi:hypothetical protein
MSLTLVIQRGSS